MTSNSVPNSNSIHPLASPLTRVPDNPGIQPSSHYRWLICSLLFFATTINYVDRQILSLLKPILDEQLGWTNEQFGYVNSAFQAAYGIGLLGVGWFIDRLGTKKGYAISVLFWSLAALGHIFVGSVAGFRWARIALGIGESGNFPAAVKATAEWFPREARASATGFFNSGTMAGAILAPATIPYIAMTLGWRWTFAFAGIAGFAWLILWMLVYRAPEAHPGVTAGELAYIRGGAVASGSPNESEISWLQLLRFKETWGYATAKFLCDPVWWFYLIWLPDFFHTAYGMDLKSFGPPIVGIYSIAIVLSLAGARFSDYLIQWGWSVNRSRKSCMLCIALLELPILLSVKHCGPWSAVVMIGLACGAHQAWAAALFSSASDLFPKKVVATIIGFGGAVSCISGFLFPVFTGRLLDFFSRAGNAKTGYEFLFALCGCSYLVAFFSNHLLARRFEPIHIKSTGGDHSR
jgi:ACS family hexuronate transporter-like MFS transporter